MKSLTLRNLDDDLQQRLRSQAAEGGQSMEAEARAILRQAMSESAPPSIWPLRCAPASRPLAAPIWIDPRKNMRDRLSRVRRRTQKRTTATGITFGGFPQPRPPGP